jgi:hypothetical protein
MFLFITMFIAFPERKDSILHIDKNAEHIQTYASGSNGFYFNGKCHITSPNLTLQTDVKLEWCSNIPTSSSGNPWIAYSLPKKKMVLTGYSLRNGCCYYSCCCIDDNTLIEGNTYSCCCMLYSFSLQGSSDNKSWSVIHKVEKRTDFYYCKYETFEFPEAQPYKYIRIILTEHYPNYPNCLILNEVDFYGRTVNDDDYLPDIENEESVSIIGRIHNE